MLYAGIDIVEISRIHKAIEEWGDRFLKRIYTSYELEDCRWNIPSLAARFAAKEATMKALNNYDRSIKFTDIEVIREPGGKPVLRLYNTAATRARNMGINCLAVSLSHSKENAVAIVVGESKK